jgi:three-Cys-motif partner protein
MARPLQFDEIGIWSEIKLAIIREYAEAYSTILSAQKVRFSHVYIDAFAGAGQHISRSTQEIIPGSPLNALAVRPTFDEFYLIDIKQDKIDNLRELVGDRKDVHLFQGDCNDILLRNVFPHVQYAQYRRGLCVLDPYGLHLDWKAISTAGQIRTLDVFLNFPVQDMNRNVFWRDPDRVDKSQIQRMNAFWGDESWRNIAYDTKRNFFGFPEKEPNETIAEAFRKRLSEVGGFRHVPDPIPMRNSIGAIVYYLFFASPNETAARIAREIFDKYRSK